MNPLKMITNLTNAVVFPFKAVFVVGLCAFINAVTSPGHWWVQWVAFGMTIALLVVWARAIKTALTAGVLAGMGYLAYRWWKGREQPARASGDTFNGSVNR